MCSAAADLKVAAELRNMWTHRGVALDDWFFRTSGIARAEVVTMYGRAVAVDFVASVRPSGPFTTGEFQQDGRDRDQGEATSAGWFGGPCASRVTSIEIPYDTAAPNPSLNAINLSGSIPFGSSQKVL